MKDTKVNEKRSAEDWVALARTFGEKCLEIQHDNKLRLDQKLEKQKALAKEISKVIQDDAHLAKNDKQAMLNAIQSYINDWSKMNEILKSDSNIMETEKKNQN